MKDRFKLTINIIISGADRYSNINTIGDIYAQDDHTTIKVEKNIQYQAIKMCC